MPSADNVKKNLTRNYTFPDAGDSPALHRYHDGQLLCYREAAHYLGLCVSYLKRLKAEGAISWVSIGTRGVRFKVAALHAWTEKREIK